jgi:hypothetical protein
MTLSLGLILAVAALVCCLLYAWHAPREASPLPPLWWAVLLLCLALILPMLIGGR